MQVFQEQKPVLITFASTDMNVQSIGINITGFQIDPLAQAQAQTIEGKEEHTALAYAWKEKTAEPLSR